MLILLVGFSQIILSVWFWYLELRLFLDEVEGRKWWALPFAAIMNVHRLIPFTMDIAITLFCVANLGFGGGVLGGISGLFLSNCVSVVIVIRSRRKRRERRDYRLMHMRA